MKGFIFDLDGTLLNTLDDLAASVNYALQIKGLPVHPVEKYARMVGNGFKMLLKRAIAPRVVPEDEFMEMLSLSKDYYGKHLMDETMPYPGMTVTLNMLLDTGATLGVLSNKPDDFSREMISHFFPNVHFEFVLGARENNPLKPDPQTLLELIKENNLDKNYVCYIGDSDVDVLTAKNAGVLSVGAAWGFRGAGELKQTGAEVIVYEPIDLLSLV